MYSVLLMMALSGGAEAPAFGHHGCCGGCYGADYSCCGGCWGCCGYDSGCCGGCYGGHHHGHHHGCCGGDWGCCGYDCGGCCGGGHHGHHHGHHHGCCGGGYGCCGYDSGCCGGGYGYSYGCCGGWSSGCCGGGYGYGAPSWGAPGGMMAPAGPAAPGAPPADLPKDGKKTSLNAPATIVVNLPADATLTIDGQATTSTSENRTFISPELAAGRDFSYTLRAEIIRDGRTLSVTEQVSVRAGEETTLSLPMAKFAAASVAAK